MAVYSAMAILGIVAGLVIGGLLVTYASWRWVLFVNVPIGLVVAALATRVLPRTGRRCGRLDLPGAITGTTGVAALVYGLSNAATTPNGVSHWGDSKVIASLAAAAVLLAAFAVIETRSRDPLLPVRVLRNRNRTGAYLMTLCVGTAMLGMFFFLTLFIQDVWGYSPLKTGLAYLPFVPVILLATVLTQQAVTRTGTRPLMMAGSALAPGAMFWLSRITEHSTFAGGVLGPEIVLGVGLGALFVLDFLTGLTKVNDNDTGVASSLVNVGQQVGGSIGLALVGTVAWSPVAGSLRTQAAAAAKAGVHSSCGNYRTSSAVTALPMIMRWISLVPSKMVKLVEVRAVSASRRPSGRVLVSTNSAPIHAQIWHLKLTPPLTSRGRSMPARNRLADVFMHRA